MNTATHAVTLKNEYRNQNINNTYVTTQLIADQTPYDFDVPSNHSIQLKNEEIYSIRTQQTWPETGPDVYHHDWNDVYSEYRLVHQFTAYQLVTNQVAIFSDIKDIVITTDTGVNLSIKDPWYLDNGEQNNVFHSLDNPADSVFLNQDPSDEYEFYALKSQRFSGWDSLAFNYWQAYDDQDTVDTNGDWAVFSTPTDYDSCMVIFKRENAKVKALFTDVAGAPATPANFNVDATGEHPLLTWSPNPEKDMDHYRIRVKYWSRLNPGMGWIVLGTTTDTSYTDTNVDPPGGGLPDFIAYKLAAVDAFDNMSAETDSIRITGDVIIWPARSKIEDLRDTPEKYMLYEPFPNPFNPIVAFRIDIPKDGFTSLIVYDISGRKVATLVNGNLSAGFYRFQWMGDSETAGLYLVRLISSDYTAVKKIILLK